MPEWQAGFNEIPRFGIKMVVQLHGGIMAGGFATRNDGKDQIGMPYPKYGHLLDHWEGKTLKMKNHKSLVINEKANNDNQENMSKRYIERKKTQKKGCPPSWYLLKRNI